MQELDEKNIVFVGTDDDLKTVLSCFKINQISHVPVMTDGKVVGMVSKTDVVEFLYENSDDYSTDSFSGVLQKITAQELMIQPLVQAKTSDSEMLILEKLLSHQVSSVVIKDEDGDLAGIVTDKDLLKYLVRDKEDNMSFGEKLGLHMVQWLDQHGIFKISKALSDIGI